MDVFILLLLILVTLIAYCYKKYSDADNESAHIPGEPTYPFVGNGFALMNKSTSELMNVALKLIAKRPNISRLLLGPQLLIYIGKPKIVEELLTSNEFIDKAEEYKSLKNWFGICR